MGKSISSSTCVLGAFTKATLMQQRAAKLCDHIKKKQKNQRKRLPFAQILGIISKSKNTGFSNYTESRVRGLGKRAPEVDGETTGVSLSA